MNVPDYQDDDEIDLAELFATIWAHKAKVLASTVAAVGIAGVYLVALATPMYEAKARFELLDNSASNPLGELGGLAALAGVSAGGGGGEADTLQDRILSRPFIEKIYDDAGFAEDPSFNPELNKPGLRTRIIRSLTGSQPEPMDREDLIGAALGYLTEELSISVMTNGLIEVGLNHKDPERAAAVTNIIVDVAIEDIHERARFKSREKLAYFAEQLSEVQSDLDGATRALSEYALNNDLRSQEDLARASTQLVALRQNASEIRERQAALAALTSIGATDFSAQDFADQFPVSSDVEFRRSLGWGSLTATWSYPEASILEAAAEQLRTRLNTVERNIELVQSQATVTGEAAIFLAELQRNVEVQSAIYEAMIQQFEAQSFTTGFESASGRQIDPAVVPDGPASPKKPLIGALSIVLGGFVGTAIALVAGLRSGRLYTMRAIQDTAREFKTIKLPAVFAKSIRLPKSVEFQRKVSTSVAVDQVIASLPSGGTSLGIVPTAEASVSAALVMGAGQKLASIHGRTLALCFGELAMDVAAFERSDAHLAENEVRDIAADFDLCHIKALKLNEIEDLMTEAKRSYKALIVVTEPTSLGVLQAHRVAKLVDGLVIVGQSGATTKEALAAALTLAKAEMPDHSILAAV